MVGVSKQKNVDIWRHLLSKCRKWNCWCEEIEAHTVNVSMVSWCNIHRWAPPRMSQTVERCVCRHANMESRSANLNAELQHVKYVGCLLPEYPWATHGDVLVKGFPVSAFPHWGPCWVLVQWPGLVFSSFGHQLLSMESAAGQAAHHRKTDESFQGVKSPDISLPQNQSAWRMDASETSPCVRLLCFHTAQILRQFSDIKTEKHDGGQGYPETQQDNSLRTGGLHPWLRFTVWAKKLVKKIKIFVLFILLHYSAKAMFSQLICIKLKEDYISWQNSISAPIISSPMWKFLSQIKSDDLVLN